MAKLFGNEYTKEELLRFAGNLKQIGGIDEICYNSGRASGLKAYLVKTGGGLDYTVLPGKCLDIPSLHYHGMNISFLAKPGITAPQYGYPAENEFENYATGGMLFTSGLRNSGPSCFDDKIYHPTHGRIGITPSENAYARCYWDSDDYFLETGGLMRESAFFGHNLSLNRKIVSKIGGNSLTLTDVVENNAPEEEEFMILYHINFGFPFIDRYVKLVFPPNKVTPRTEEAKSGLLESETITDPQDGFLEHVFFRDAQADKDGIVTVSIENNRLGIGANVRYEKKNLPNLIEWKSMRSGDYALGIEPCNSFIHGRSGERENGSLQKIAPFQKVEISLSLEFFDL